MCCPIMPEWDTESKEEPGLKGEALKVLELNAGKLARSVPRGGSRGNAAFLPDNLLTITYPDAGKAQFTYDAAGNQTSSKDPNGNETTTEYNAYGKPLLIWN